MATIPTTLYPVPARLRRRLWLGAMAALLFMLASFIEGFFREEYDSWQQAVSALSLGPRGWIQMISFIAFGIVILGTAPAWKRILAGGTGSKAIPVLISLTGISLVLCGLIPQDPAPGYDPENLRLTAPSLPGLVHLLLAAVSSLCSVAALLVMARRFNRNGQWNGWTFFTLLMAALMVTCITIYGVWSTREKGYAGLFERVGIMVIPVWTLCFLLELEKGRGFMVDAGEKNQGSHSSLPAV